MECKQLKHIMSGVHVWQEDVTIPTYDVGKPNKNPIFLENRVYQGSSGKVYPHPVTEQIADKSEMKTYRAVQLLKRATEYPENLGEGKLVYTKENNIYYFMGKAYTDLKDEANALRCFGIASFGDEEPAGMLFYNDQPPEMVFYKGLALKALGKEADALRCFDKLVAYGKLHENDYVRIDYFAISIPDLMIFEEDLDERNRMHCRFMTALGCMGQGKTDAARKLMDEIASKNPSHQGVQIHRELLKWPL